MILLNIVHLLFYYQVEVGSDPAKLMSNNYSSSEN